MLALATVFVTSLGLALSGAMMPGPLLTTTISESVRRGGATGPLLILGHAILELAMVVALLVGLAPFLARNWVFAAVALLGAIVLTGMAVGMFRALPTLRIDWEAHRQGSGPLVSTGILVSLSNPYWAIWWATIGLGLLTKAYALGIAGLAVFYVGHITGDLTWYSLISGAISAGRRFITLRVYKGMLLAASVFLLALAMWFLVSGIGLA